MLPALDEDEILKEYRVTIKEEMHLRRAKKKEPVVIPTDKGDIVIHLAKRGKPNTVWLPAQCGLDLTLELFKKGGHPGRRVHVPPFHDGYTIIIPGFQVTAALTAETDMDMWIGSNGFGMPCGSPQ